MVLVSKFFNYKKISKNLTNLTHLLLLNRQSFGLHLHLLLFDLFHLIGKFSALDLQLFYFFLQFVDFFIILIRWFQQFAFPTINLSHRRIRT